MPKIEFVIEKLARNLGILKIIITEVSVALDRVNSDKNKINEILNTSHLKSYPHLFMGDCTNEIKSLLEKSVSVLNQRVHNAKMLKEKCEIVLIDLKNKSETKSLPLLLDALAAEAFRLEEVYGEFSYGSYLSKSVFRDISSDLTELSRLLKL